VKVQVKGDWRWGSAVWDEEDGRGGEEEGHFHAGQVGRGVWRVGGFHGFATVEADRPPAGTQRVVGREHPEAARRDVGAWLVDDWAADTGRGSLERAL